MKTKKVKQMETKRAKVIMLPTEDYPAIAQSNSHIKAFGVKKEKLYGWIDCPIRTDHTLHHQYITTEDKIKVSNPCTNERVSVRTWIIIIRHWRELFELVP